MTKLKLLSGYQLTFLNYSLPPRKINTALIIIMFIVCFGQNCALAITENKFKDITSLFNQIEQQAINGNEDKALLVLNEILDIPFKDFFDAGIKFEKILLIRIGAFKIRGIIRLYNQGFYKEAINDFTEALTCGGKITKSQNPMALMFLTYRAEAYFFSGDYQKAIDDISYCINIFDEYNNLPGAEPADLPKLYLMRAICYSAKNQGKKAIKDLRKTIKLGNVSDWSLWIYAYECDIGLQRNLASFFFNKVTFSKNKFYIKYLDKPISIQTKAFISKTILSASKYIPIPENLKTKAGLIYSKTYSNKQNPKKNNQLPVKKIQELLKTIGYNPGPVDGIMGKQTRAAICDYQKNFNIPVDGQATEELYKNLRITRKAIEKQTTVSSSIKSNVPKVIKEVMPAVVTVKVYDEDNSLVSVGSGFFVKKSVIVTNLHVIGTSPYVKIKTYDGKYYGVTKILKDHTHDLALILLDKNCSSKKILKINKNLPEIGQNIIAIGNPLGMEQTVSDGIVSSIRRFKGNRVLIQISAPISPGSSGGPILNHKGEVIGIATLTFREGQNINLAVSGKHVYELLKNNL